MSCHRMRPMNREANHTLVGLFALASLTGLGFALGFAVKDLHIANGASYLAAHGPWVHAAAVGFALLAVLACVLMFCGLVLWVCAEAVLNVWKMVYAIGVAVSFVRPGKARGGKHG